MRKFLHKKYYLGFTLIELLVVISIISMLSSVVLSQVNSARIKARDVSRVQSLVEMRKLLELYYDNNLAYPKTFDPGNPLVFRGQCFGNPDDYVPDLVPTYIAKLPSDPVLDCNGVTHAWLYASDGIDYKLITHIEAYNENYYPAFADPTEVPGSPCYTWGLSHYGVWSDGAACWLM